MPKTDMRVRYTRRVLKQTFLSLLGKKPVSRITVKEVCELSDINRATFYAHYADCFALLESIENELLDAFAVSLKSVQFVNVSSMIEAIYAMVDQNKTACRVLIFDGKSTTILGKMTALAKSYSINIWRKRLPHATEDDLEMLYTHLSNGLLHVVVEGYDKYPKEKVIHFVNEILKASLALYA